jgi:hypothetical protein
MNLCDKCADRPADGRESEEQSLRSTGSIRLAFRILHEVSFVRKKQNVGDPRTPTCRVKVSLQELISIKIGSGFGSNMCATSKTLEC